MKAIFRAARRTVGYFSYFFSALSVIGLLALGLKRGLIAPLQGLLDTYKALTASFASIIDPVIWFFVHAANWFGLALPYNKWWVEMFVPITLYAFAIVYGTSTAHRRSYSALALAIVFLPISLGSSLVASNWPLDADYTEPVLVISAGLAVVHFLAVVWYSTVMASQGSRVYTFLRFFAAYPLANVAIAASIILVSSRAKPFGFSFPSVVQLVAIVTLMSIRDIAAGAYGAIFEGGRFKNYATTVQGARTLFVISCAIVAIAFVSTPTPV